MHLSLLFALHNPALAVDRVVAMDGARPRDRAVDTVVVHATGGPSCNPRINHKGGTLNGIVEYFRTRDDGISIHYVIGRDGTTVRMVPEDQVAQHIGSYNSRSIGIELVNNGDGVQPFPKVQQEALVSLLDGILDRHALDAQAITTHSNLSRHHFECVEGPDGRVREVGNREGRGRKANPDPGPLLPLRDIRARVTD